MRTDSNEKSRIEIDAVIRRMKIAAGVGSVAALSKRVGYKSNAIQNTISRGHVPFKEAALLALKDGVSLDWLIFGREDQSANAGAVPIQDSVRPESSRYKDRKRSPALFVAEEGELGPEFAERNERAYEVLKEVIEGVEAALIESGFDMSAKRKAELIATLFEIYASAQARPSRNHILRLVRSAS